MESKSDKYGNLPEFNGKPNPSHQGRNIETKVTENFLKFFCVDNAENIVGCKWCDTKYCMKSCKFYKNERKRN